MSKIKFQKEIELLIKNRHKIPEEFWIDTPQRTYKVIWFLNRQRPSVARSYDFDEERLGLTKEGKIIWGFDSGCSCPSPWQDAGDKVYEVKEWKEFVVMAEKTATKKRGDGVEYGNKDYDYQWLDDTWEEETAENLKDYLLLISKPKASDVVTAKNAEVRRFLMKRIGFAKVKKDVGAVSIHVDGDSELLKFKDGDCYVKVKDSSTKREYLLYVPAHMKTCREAIAWTFGLSAHEYQPIIET